MSHARERTGRFFGMTTIKQKPAVRNRDVKERFITVGCIAGASRVALERRKTGIGVGLADCIKLEGIRTDPPALFLTVPRA